MSEPPIKKGGKTIFKKQKSQAIKQYVKEHPLHRDIYYFIIMSVWQLSKRHRAQRYSRDRV